MADESKPTSAAPPEYGGYGVPTQSHNPGSYDELHRKCREVFPTCFEGMKFMVQKGLSSHFQISHTVSVSQANTGYRFGATYVGSKQTGPGESFPVLLGDTDASGNTSATVLHQFGDKWRLKLQGQVQQSKLSAAQSTFERRGRLSTLGLTVANPDLVNGNGIVVGHFLRRITERFDLGAELVYQYDKKNIPGKQMSVLSYAARYSAPTWIASGTVGPTGLHGSYYHKQSDTLQFGVEFESNFRLQEAVTTLAYQVDLPEANMTLRASFDTNWTVGGVLEKKLSTQLPFSLAISGLLNHVKAQGKFGVGLIIGG
jgi:mitochondrial import receptor subunit TOM40